jgi:hypothetical protein
MSTTAPLTTEPDSAAEARRAELMSMEINDVANGYRRQYPSKAATASHLCYMLACATIRQWKLENKQIALVDRLEMGDPILVLVERYRAAAERSFHRALKELKELLQNEANPESASSPKFDKTKPIRPTMEQLRAQHPGIDRNQLARMRAGMPLQP